ncbi:MAG: hypothetical protein JST54_03505 [Deltaproteobacteria bacterium]|nr:hypothetical protein [Deltaproteobacteria bacterium]
MIRRFATIACAMALLVTLVVAFGHHHAAVVSGADLDTAGCAFCAGGMAAPPEPDLAPLMAALHVELLVVEPTPAPRKVVLPLAHSGNAPPSWT